MFEKNKVDMIGFISNIIIYLYRWAIITIVVKKYNQISYIIYYYHKFNITIYHSITISSFDLIHIHINHIKYSLYLYKTNNTSIIDIADHTFTYRHTVPL